MFEDLNKQSQKLKIVIEKRRCLSLEIEQICLYIFQQILSQILNTLKLMFIDNIRIGSLSSAKSIKGISNPQQTKSIDLTDLQFQLCSNFLKQTKQKLYHQEAQLLVLNQSLITKVQQKLNTSSLNNYTNIKDISLCQDTTTYSFQGQQQQDVFSQSCKSMLILRKSKSTTSLRRTQNDYTLLLKQIQNKCSDRTNHIITTLIDQNKKLKQKISTIQKKEKQLKKKQIDYQKQQQQFFILKKKANQYDKVINSLHTEIAALKLKLKQSQSTLKRSKSPTHDLQIPQVIEIQTTLKLFLNQKEHVISESTKRLKQLYLQVQNKIQQPFSNDQTCQKCCQMLKKIKSSILKYRQLMQAEANAIEGLYQKFKVKFK